MEIYAVHRTRFIVLVSVLALAQTLCATSDAASRSTRREAEAAADQAESLPTIEVGAARSETAGGYRTVTSSTATLTQTPILDIPQAVNTAPAQALLDQNATTLTEALQNISNVTVANTLGGTQDAFIRRGFGDNRDGGVLTDGLRTVLPRSFNATSERVEVLKGPASTLYGIQEPGGVINVIVKKPQENFAATLGGSLTSFGGGHGDFDITGPIANTGFAYRLIGEYQNVDYWRNFGRINQRLVSPSLSWRNESTTATVSYTNREYSLPFDRGAIFDLATGKPAPVERSVRMDERYNVTRGWSDLFLVGLEHKFDDVWKLKTNYAYSQDFYSDNQARVIAYDSRTGVLTRRSDATQGSTQKNHNARIDLTGMVDVAGLTNELLFGFAFNDYSLLRTNMLRCKNQTGFNIYSPAYGALQICTTVSNADSDQTSRQTLYNGYVQDALHLTDQWILVAGASYQYYTQMAGKGRPFVLNTDAQGGAFMPRAGLVYKATDKLSFYANYATSFMPQVSIADYVGALPPERGVSYEAGVKFDILAGLTGTAALFNIEKKNVLYTEVVNGESYARTAGKVRSRGFEFDLVGAVTEDIDLIASYGYTDARIVEDPENAGNVPANVARHTYSLFATHNLGNVWDDNTLRIGGGFHGRGKAPGVAANSYWLPSYMVFDAMLAYTIVAEHPVTIQLNLKNLFNTAYYTSSQASNNLGNAIGEPFQAVLSARWRF